MENKIIRIYSEEARERMRSGGSRGGKKTVQNRSPEEWEERLKKMLEGRKTGPYPLKPGSGE